MTTMPAAPTATVVVMGVSACGKSTIAHELVDRLGWAFAEGDDFHSDANVAKMHAGHALTDDDRWPWLRSIAAWIGAREQAGDNAIVTCSALRRSYRDLLRAGHPSVFFVHLTASRAVLSDRIAHRQGHYMPTSLLASQLATLEPLAADEPGAAVDVDDPPDVVAERVITLLPERSGTSPESETETE